MGEAVRFPTSDGPRPGYLAAPPGVGRRPAVVVVHEIHGLEGPIRDAADRFAASGYVSLAVDLFSDRSRPACIARILAPLVRPLSNLGLSELRAALHHLTTLENVDPNRMGAVGFCLGGTYVTCWAATDSRLQVVAPYYGQMPRPAEAVRRSCPVVGSYPAKDPTARSGRRLKRELDAAGIDNDIVIYPGARHSFANASSHNYDAEASEDSWRRVLSFFADRLRPGEVSA